VKHKNVVVVDKVASTQNVHPTVILQYPDEKLFESKTCSLKTLDEISEWMA